MLQHKDLRHTPEFVKFLTSNDIDFTTHVEKDKKQTSSISGTLSSIWENMPTPSAGMVSGLVSKLWDRGEKPKKEKS